ncbi:MAG: flagella basal body P-ring formation protein FlgA [Actinobacteria bacterium]|nr:flagella basal body P-ring formation protein FlgA [Actinomycetota bacterium]MBW3650772.1 flagella basal body P-ring formation protein FlgA [Actinomycetota bacterium]
MTTTTSRPEVANALRLAPPPARQRRWSLAVVGLLLTLGAALAFAVLWMNAGERRPVLVMARAVPAGQVITAADLQVVRVATDPGVAVVPSERRARVVGSTAGVDLVAGALLSDAQLGRPTAVAAGEAVVGVPLRPSQMPARLRPGDRVAVVDTGVNGGRAGVVITEAKVLGTTTAADGNVVVSLVVAEPVAGPVTALVAAERARIFLLPA